MRLRMIEHAMTVLMIIDVAIQSEIVELISRSENVNPGFAETEAAAVKSIIVTRPAFFFRHIHKDRRFGIQFPETELSPLLMHTIDVEISHHFGQPRISFRII